MKQFKFLQNKTVKLFSLCGVFCLLQFATQAQALDSKGTDFWLTFPGNLSTPQLSFFISADQNTTGTVTIPGLGFSMPFSVTVGSVTTINLPATAELGSTSNTITNLGIHVIANQEVTVYGLNRVTATTDGYLGLPTDILGTEYIVLGYKNSDIVNGTQFAIVATANATTVTITPTLTTDGHPAGIPYNVILNQGQTYQVRNTGSAPNDLSGSIVIATKPIAVFGGHQCVNIPPGSFACDYIVEELPPTTAWGKNFVTVPLKTRRNGDTFRFLASTSNTQVRVNGTLVATLNRGQLFETILTTSSQITSTEPILVAQYSNSSTFDGVTSDPFMMLITPYEQFLGNYTFSTPATGFSLNFVNVVVPAAAVGAIRLDGTIVPSSAFTAIGSTGFRGAQLDVALGAHTLNGTNLPFGIFVYGFDSYDSYGYPGGQSLAPIATATSLTITPKTGTAIVGTEQCFDAFVKDQFNNPVVGVRVDFTITGANPGSTGFANTNASGIAHYCYTGTNTGTDNITASLGTLNDASTFIWAPIGNVYYSKSTGDLHNVLTWGKNTDGSGENPPDFTTGKTFNLRNRPGIYTLTNNWTVGGILDIPAASQLQINNFTLSVADITGTGSFSGTTASNLIVTQPSSGGTSLNFIATANALNNFSIISAATTTLTAALNVYGVLTLTNGTLNTGNVLTIKSTAANTARVAPVTGNISGTVTVERYIPARRAWRILAAPVGGSQTINAAWQEGATTASANPNPNPGFGTHITEGSPANGFDQNPFVAMISAKRYISSTNAWTALTNTNTTSVNSDAFMLFVRGNRGTSLGYNDVPATNTTLRATGPLKVGDQLFPVSASGFTAIPNPFASPINFATITRNNVQNNFYLWDPKIGGTNGAGAYVTVSFNGSTYDVSSNTISPESQYIQSGQGFLVFPVTSGVAGSLIIKESDKSNTAATDVFRTAGGNSNSTRSNAPVFADPTQGNGLRLQLQAINPDNTTVVLDEVFASYKPGYSNKVDQWDAVKATNMAENLGMVKDDKTLAIERKLLPSDGEVINLKLWNTEPKNYMLEINPVNLSTTGLYAYLEDKYLKTTTPVSLDKVSQVRFNINSSAASARADRFNIVFSKKGTLSELITKSSITAYPNPVTGRSINLQFSGHTEGTYLLSLINSAGNVVLERKLQYTDGAGILTLPLDKKLTTGVYKLQVKGKDTNETVQILCN